MTNWEEHYRTGDTPWDKGEASPALEQALERVPVSGRVLVPGCGFGHDVRALARLPEVTEVLGLDIAPSAVAGAREIVPVGKEHYALQDFFALPPELRGAFDWVWEHTCFCAIEPAMRPAYVEAVAAALKPGGQFLAVFYLDPGQPSPEVGPPYEVSIAELDRLFDARLKVKAEWLPTRTYANREGKEWVRWCVRKE